MRVGHLFISLFLVLCTGYSIDAIIPLVCLGNATRPEGRCCPVAQSNGMVCGGPSRGTCMHIFDDSNKVNRGFQPFTRESVASVWSEDDRVNWPARFFKLVCQCNTNFFGISCDECYYNREGPNCEHTKRPKVRRNLLSLSPAERVLLLNVLDKSQTEDSKAAVLVEDDNKWSDPLKQPQFVKASVQYFIVALHRFCSRSTLFEDKNDCSQFGILDFNHDGTGFVTWHRYLCLMWEKMLADIALKYFQVKDFALPYWDWIDKTDCDVCTNDLMGAIGEKQGDSNLIHASSPFSKWTEYCSEPVMPVGSTEQPACYGCHRNPKFGKLTRRFNSKSFPTSADIKFIMDKKKYYVSGDRRDRDTCQSFMFALEGFCGRPGVDKKLLFAHNQIHNMIDGSMCCSASGTSEPLFIFHHTAIDRITHCWQRRNRINFEDMKAERNDAFRPSHCPTCTMCGFLPIIKHNEMMTNTENLGYTYDNCDKILT